jgi:hypothetical protein
MTSTKFILSLFLSVILAAGCSDDDVNNTPADGAVPDMSTGVDQNVVTPDQAVAKKDRGASFKFSLQFKDHKSGAFIAGVKVCIKDTTTCVTATGTGITAVANVVLPTNKDSILLCTVKDYMSMAIFVGKDNTEVGTSSFMIPNSWEAAMATKAGVTIDKTKAMMRLTAVDNLGGGYGNATLALTPKAGDGPMASDKDGYPDPTKATTGALGLAWAWYFNVPVADATMQVKDNDGNLCDVFIGWKGATKDIAKFKPVAGHINVAEFRCTKQKGM